MQQLTISINNKDVNIIVVETGESPRKVREALGHTPKDWMLALFAGDDFEDLDDLAFEQPEIAQAIKNAGITNPVCVVELQ